ncbi:MAG: DUF2786 domain-containing protein, partial [Lentisphaeraceae bacterium]|nr:DUF2786 domain-containing protein [Lentisphaeraceae bacterium]
MNIDLIRGWCCRLQKAYDDINDSKALGLKAANLQVLPLAGTMLGYWNKEVRQICLDCEALLKYSWHDIQMILKHEMAHQLVDEKLSGGDGKPHGKAFEKACTLLGIPANASTQLTAGAEHPISRKIAKLMALADSCNLHEAEAALAKAQELTFKHNLEQIKIAKSSYSFRPIGPYRSKVPAYEKQLMHILQEQYFVKALTTWRYDNNQAFKQFEIYGTPENLENAAYIYDFLKQEAEFLWLEYRQKYGRQVSRMKSSFTNGLFIGFQNKLNAEKEVLKSKYEVIALNNPHLDDF